MENTDFEKWVQQWDKACKDGVFAETKPYIPTTEVHPTDFFGSWHPSEKETTLKDVDANYWNQVYKLSNHSGDAPDILNEQDNHPEERVSKIQDKPLRKLPAKKVLGTKGKELANTANPVEPPSRGIDQRRKVTPDWSDGPDLIELDELKKKVLDLQAKLNSDEDFGSFRGDSKKMKAIQGQIDKIKDDIDYLSNSLSPDFVQDELS